MFSGVRGRWPLWDVKGVFGFEKDGEIGLSLLMDVGGGYSRVVDLFNGGCKKKRG